MNNNFVEIGKYRSQSEVKLAVRSLLISVQTILNLVLNTILNWAIKCDKVPLY